MKVLPDSSEIFTTASPMASSPSVTAFRLKLSSFTSMWSIRLMALNDASSGPEPMATSCSTLSSRLILTQEVLGRR